MTMFTDLVGLPRPEGPIAFTNRIRIDRPPQAVSDYLADLRNLPAWNYAISETRPLTPGDPAAGMRYRQFRTLPRPGEEQLEIVEYVRGQRLVVEGGLGPFHGRTSYSIEAVGNGTELRNDIELAPSFPAATVGRLVGRSIANAVGQNLSVLKDILEREPSPNP
jgi:hypothetical protein